MQMTIVYTPGVWDLLHVGHVAFLERARSFGTSLIVGVPSDEVVKTDKGSYPIIPLEQRIKMLTSLKCVDVAIPYYDLEFITHLSHIRPDILVVGETWGGQKRHRDAEEWAAANGCRFIKLPYTRGVSSTSIKERIAKCYRVEHCYD